MPFVASASSEERARPSPPRACDPFSAVGSSYIHKYIPTYPWGCLHKGGLKDGWLAGRPDGRHLCLVAMCGRPVRRWIFSLLPATNPPLALKEKKKPQQDLSLRDGQAFGRQLVWDVSQLTMR